MLCRTVVDYEGPRVDPEWERSLRAISPVRDTATYLKLVWVAGDVIDSRFREADDPDRPRGLVERWFIYQMHPLPMLSENMLDLVLEDLCGPDPRTRGRLDAKTGLYHPDPSCNIDRMQWLLFKETGCYGRPYWVIQGSNGGHKRRWNSVEKRLSILNDGPSDPPVPGSLPYAEPDERVWEQLRQWDKMKQLVDILAAYDKNPDYLEDADVEQMDEMQKVVAAWIGKQVDEAGGWAGESGSAFRLGRELATA